MKINVGDGDGAKGSLVELFRDWRVEELSGGKGGGEKKEKDLG